MISIVTIVGILICIYLTYKKPEFGILTTLLLLSLGPIVDSVLPSGTKYLLLIFIMICLYIKTNRNYISANYYVLMVLFFIKELLTLGLTGSITSFMIAICYFCVVPTITYFSYIHMCIKNVNYLNHLKIYIAISLAIQFYRTFFDITFFGFASYDFDLNKYSDLMTVGSELFRPSNLESCIIFAIELAVFLSLLVINEGVTKKTIPFILFGTIGLILTLSRSGLLIFLITVMYFLYKKGQIKWSVLFILLVATFSIYLGFLERLSEMTDLHSETYEIRINSMNTVWNKVQNFDFSTLLFGYGSGSANRAATGVNGDFTFYVENFFLAILIDNGVFSLVAIAALFFKSLYVAVRKNRSLALLLSLVIITNFMSCNMISYCVEIFVLLISVPFLYNKKLQQYVEFK